MSNGPVRTCVGCRMRKTQATLLRFRRGENGKVEPARHGGRGRSVYTCSNRDCVVRAARKRAFEQGLGRGLSLYYEVEALWAFTGQDISGYLAGASDKA